ncbi:MAG TPA: FHA domain-containing protein [Spirochaetota bacterium]|nr:FHA domain-containing protein [Spirochaetota bacterium]HOL57140.1 FHA domain-containing protein [Spirochaetota bacterium]HPP05084.1 FHA domain-containing protein [Spirochaetota bacterium]
MSEKTDTINTELSHKLKPSFSSLLEKRGVLLILSSNFIGKTFIIDKPKVIIGRSEKSDFCIKDPLISKEHCLITVTEDCKFFIEDLNSTNSTFVNGKEIKKKTQIFYGERIVIGETIIRFYLEEKLDKK